MTGELKINGYDAYSTWGISMDTSSLSALMTPPSMKSVISIDSRLSHGVTAINNNPKKAARDLNLTLSLIASTETQFFNRYNSFCQQLATGELIIETKYQQGLKYKCLYNSCTQFSQFVRGIAKFSLKLTEKNPNDRT